MTEPLTDEQIQSILNADVEEVPDWFLRVVIYAAVAVTVATVWGLVWYWVNSAL